MPATLSVRLLKHWFGVAVKHKAKQTAQAQDKQYLITHYRYTK